MTRPRRTRRLSAAGAAGHTFGRGGRRSFSVQTAFELLHDVIRRAASSSAEMTGRWRWTDGDLHGGQRNAEGDECGDDDHESFSSNGLSVGDGERMPDASFDLRRRTRPARRRMARGAWAWRATLSRCAAASEGRPARSTRSSHARSPFANALRRAIHTCGRNRATRRSHSSGRGRDSRGAAVESRQRWRFISLASTTSTRP